MQNDPSKLLELSEVAKVMAIAALKSEDEVVTEQKAAASLAPIDYAPLHGLTYKPTRLIQIHTQATHHVRIHKPFSAKRVIELAPMVATFAAKLPDHETSFDIKADEKLLSQLKQTDYALLGDSNRLFSLIENAKLYHAVVASYDWLSADDLTALYPKWKVDDPEAALKKKHERGQLLGLPIAGKFSYPAAQFDETSPSPALIKTLKPIIKSLKQRDLLDEEILYWLSQPSSRLVPDEDYRKALNAALKEEDDARLDQLMAEHKGDNIDERSPLQMAVENDTLALNEVLLSYIPFTEEEKDAHFYHMLDDLLNSYATAKGISTDALRKDLLSGPKK